MHGIDAMNYQDTTPIQEMAIPQVLEGKDLLACAQTGTGKTAAFAIPVVDKLHGTLKFHAWFPGCPMEEDAYGIPKPKDTEVVVPTLLFVPCVGYGLGGYRLGYGGGFYDRTLANLQPKPYTVGLGFANAFLLDLKPEPHDVPLDALLNDQGVVWPVT